MMLTLPTLVAALVLPASAQIFRLPDADACEKSKTSVLGIIFTFNNSIPEINGQPVPFQHFILDSLF